MPSRRSARLKVEFYAGDRLLGETVLPPYSLRGVSLPSGAHVVTARAIDDRGGMSESDPVTIKVP
jgi:P pilus assembly chaperone PapD